MGFILVLCQLVKKTNKVTGRWFSVDDDDDDDDNDDDNDDELFLWYG